MKWNIPSPDELRDESGLTGFSERILYPSSIDELKEAMNENWSFTIQGNRTGIMGGACPPSTPEKETAILNMTRFNKIENIVIENGEYFIQVQSGVLLSDIKKQLKKENLFFPVDSTEETASIGGAFSCNAKGLSSYKYGSCSNHVQEITVLTGTGTLLTIPKGKYLFTKDGCQLPNGEYLSCQTLSEKKERIPLLPYEGMDLIDLFAGSEGTLGIILSLKLKVLPLPSCHWALVFFFLSDEEAISFAEQIKETRVENAEIISAEFFDFTSLSLINCAKNEQTSLESLPDFPESASCALLLEAIADSDEDMEELLFLLLELSNQDEDFTWAADSPIDRERFRSMRHAVPEQINHHIQALHRSNTHIHKVALDFSGPDKELKEYYSLYRHIIDEADITATICGHILENRLHVNFLPSDYEEFQKSVGLVEKTACQVSQRGGCLCAENGIGKLKYDLIQKFLSETEKKIQKEIKFFFDPQYKYS